MANPTNRRAKIQSEGVDFVKSDSAEKLQEPVIT